MCYCLLSKSLFAISIIITVNIAPKIISGMRLNVSLQDIGFEFGLGRPKHPVVFRFIIIHTNATIKVPTIRPIFFFTNSMAFFIVFILLMRHYYLPETMSAAAPQEDAIVAAIIAFWFGLSSGFACSRACRSFFRSSSSSLRTAAFIASRSSLVVVRRVCIDTIMSVRITNAQKAAIAMRMTYRNVIIARRIVCRRDIKIGTMGKTTR